MYHQRSQKILLENLCKRYALTPTTLSQSSNHSTSYAGRWSTSGSRGQRTFLYLHKNTIEGTEKIEGQTNKHEQSLGLTKSRGRYCNTICMYGLSLAWVTSENSTMLLESDSSWLTLAGPYPMLPRLSAPVSGVDCPSVDPRQPLCSPLSVQPPTASLLSSRQLPSPGSCRQLPFASPYHFRIRRDFMSKNPLSGFAPKQTRLPWQPTHIVLHTSLSYPCHLFSINYNTI